MKASPEELIELLWPVLKNGPAVVTTSQAIDLWQCTGQTVRRRMQELARSGTANVIPCKTRNASGRVCSGFYITDLRKDRVIHLGDRSYL